MASDVKNEFSTLNWLSSFERSSLITSGRFPWCVILWITVVSMNKEIIRLESVSNASLITSNIIPVFLANSRASSISSGGLAVTFGFGLYSNSSELCSHCSSSRTEDKYWSIRARSDGGSSRFRRFDCSPTKSSMLLPCLIDSILASISSFFPCRNSV